MLTTITRNEENPNIWVVKFEHHVSKDKSYSRSVEKAYLPDANEILELTLEFQYFIATEVLVGAGLLDEEASVFYGTKPIKTVPVDSLRQRAKDIIANVLG